MNNPEQRNQEVTPFKEELVETGFNERIKTFISDPEKIVRINREEESIKALREKIKTGKALLEELRDTYHVPMTNFEFIIGPFGGGGKPRIYTITERIHGENLQEIEFSSEQKKRAREQLDSLYSSLAEYFSNVYRKKCKYLWDITKPQQYVYGKRQNDAENSLYLVDLEYFFNRDFSTDDSYKSFFNYVQWLYFDIKGMEKKMGMPLNKAMQKFTEFVNSIHYTDPDYNIIENLKSWMTLS